MPRFFGVGTRILFISCFLFLGAFLAFAEDLTSTNFIVRDSQAVIYGGYSTSTSFQHSSAGGQTVAGTASSNSFQQESGILYYSTPAAAAGATAGGGGGGGGGQLEPIKEAEQRETLRRAQDALRGAEDYLAKLTPIEKIIEFIEPILPPFLKPKLPPKPELPPVEEVVKPVAPPALQGVWNLISQKALGEFVLKPLPLQLRVLAQKFPEVKQAFEKIGIRKITDLQKLQETNLDLPGLTETIGLPRVEVVPDKFVLPKGVPLAELPLRFKQELPTEIVFARGGAELIDLNIKLGVTDEGKVEQRVRTVAGQTLRLVVKPDGPAKRVTGYLVFKGPISDAALISLQDLTASALFAGPKFAEKFVETELVAAEFEYTNPDGDGIYTAEIEAPAVEGEYEAVTIVEYLDPELGTRAIRLVMVVDPEGYVYEQSGRGEIRVAGAVVSLFWFNSETRQYELWPADEYRQTNPQITKASGKYSFLVPEGTYYLKVEAPGYLDFEGKAFDVKEGQGIHQNIELKTKLWWLRGINLTTILLILLIALLAYNFYRDKIRK